MWDVQLGPFSGISSAASLWQAEGDIKGIFLYSDSVLSIFPCFVLPYHSTPATKSTKLQEPRVWGPLAVRDDFHIYAYPPGMPAHGSNMEQRKAGT